MPLPPGTMLGPYELQELLGRGGMGDVYRARDVRLGRTVAVKILPPRLNSDADRLARFEREARLAATLNHPGIIVVHDVGEASGIRFIAMEYVEGETLAASISRGPLPMPTVAELGSQIADALARAHGAGVVHRDLKPSNIMLTRDHRAKVLDFGLSKLIEPADEFASTIVAAGATTPGILIGTAAYMSPEQARGLPADARSDQFAFGVILYELLTRHHPFERGSSVQTLSAIIEDEPPPIGEHNPRVPEALALVIERCLAKEPSQRFESTSELALALRSICDHLRSGRALASVPRVRRLPRGWLAASALAGVAAFAGALGWQQVVDRTAPDAARHVAVLQLAPIGEGAELEMLGEGLAEVLTTRLTELERFAGSLRVVPAAEVRREQITSAGEARLAFGVNVVVMGSIQRRGDALRLTLNVVDPLTRRIVKAETVDATLQDASLLQDDVVMRVARLLDLEVQPQARSVVVAGGTSAPGAYEFYLQGRGYLRRYERPEDLELAISLFERAVAEDGRFALAHAALAEAYWRNYETTRDASWVERATAAGTAAVDLSPSLASARVTLALIATGTGRYEEAVAELGRVLDDDPTNADAYRELARAYQALDRFDEAERTFEAAIRARPGDWLAYNQLGAFYSQRRRFEDAAVQFERVVALTPDNARGHSNLGGTYAQLRRFDEAIAAFERAVTLNPASAALPNLGTLYFRQRRYEDAARAFERAIETRGQDYRSWRNLASAYLWIPGAQGKARDAYGRAATLVEDALEVNPRQPLLLAHLAECRAHLGDQAEARRLIAEAEALAPQDGSILLLSAQVHEWLGDRSRALAKVAAAIERGVPFADIETTKSLERLRADPAYRAGARQ